MPHREEGTMLNALAREIHAVAVDKGFWPEHENMAVAEDTDIHYTPLPERNFPEQLMLIVTEVSEAMEAYRDAHPDSEAGPIAHWYRGAAGKPEGVPSELADIIIRTLDICGAYGIDIQAAIAEKMIYNRRRPRLHGRAR